MGSNLSARHDIILDVLSIADVVLLFGKVL